MPSDPRPGTGPSRPTDAEEEFPPVTLEQWREAVVASGGRPAEQLTTASEVGPALQPLYTEAESHRLDAAGFPGQPPFARGSTRLGRGWRIVQEHSSSVTPARIAEDLAGGVRSFLIHLVPGTTVTQLADLFGGEALRDVEIGLESGSDFLEGASLLSALWQRTGVPAGEGPGSFRADPLGALASSGALPVSPTRAMEQMAALAQWSNDRQPCGFDTLVSTQPYHDAGADAAQELAAALATGVEYLRALQSVGLQLETVCPRILFSVPVDSDPFESVPKLRALRLLWARVLEIWEAPPAQRGAFIEARSSRRSLTRFAPWLNLLRGTMTCFGGALGGAQRIVISAYDQRGASQTAGEDGEGPEAGLAARLARNTHHLLNEESHLGEVIDPAGGAWYFEQRTRELAEAGWEQFQTIETHGGMAAVLEDGWLAREIEVRHTRRAERVRTRRLGITGVSEFPDSGEASAPPRECAPDAPREPAGVDLDSLRAALNAGDLVRSLDALVGCALEDAPLATLAREVAAGADTPASLPHAFPFRSIAAPFEELRLATELHQAQTGERPRVFLASLGPQAVHQARTNFTRQLLVAGGLEPLLCDGYPDVPSAVAAFRESATPLAVICSSDDLYAEHAGEMARGLREAGATTLGLAGRPCEADVDHFVFVGSDVCEFLEKLLAAAGVRIS